MKADDEQAGSPTTCSCGAAVVVPIELQLEEGPVSGDAKTMTLDEIRALRNKRKQ
jgi:hypothetical protein